MIRSMAIFMTAALAEIGGCFSVWAVLRLSAPSWWLLPGFASLAVFAYLLTLIDADAAGRTFAAYGGIYIAMSLLWLRTVEGFSPDRWDIAGAALSIAGATVIIFGPRAG